MGTKHEQVQADGGWLPVVLLSVLFFLGAKLSLALAVMPDALVMMWIPNAIVLARLLRVGWRRFGRLALGVMLAELAADVPTYSVVEALCFGAINLAEVVLAYALLRRWRFDPALRAPLDIGKFVLAAPLLSALMSACLGAWVYYVFRDIDRDLPDFLAIWWFSDGTGLMILTPLALSLWQPGQGFSFERPEFRWYDGLAFLLTLALLVPLLLSYQRLFDGLTVRAFFLLLPLLYVAARFSVRVTAANVAVVSLVLLYLVKNGQQPFGPLSTLETVTSAQELIFVMSTLSLGIAALLAQHRESLREMESRVAERTAELTRANAELRAMAVTDPLTGVHNRRTLYEALVREMARTQRYAHPLALIMLDIDHFKAVNDRHGHDAGDAVLRDVARRCREALRETDLIARYGGEEFMVLAPDTPRDEAVALAERLRLALRETPARVGGVDVPFTASFGVTLLMPEDVAPGEPLKRVDRALYAAKEAGRDRVESL